MAENRTVKSCYESRYGAGWITGPKRLAEIMCERIAGDITLGARFWQNRPWDKVFVRELTFANKLLNTPFAMEAIMKALHSKRGLRVNTLGAAFFREMIVEEQDKLNVEAKRLEMASTPDIVNTLETPRPVKRAGKSIRERLADNAPTKQGELFNSDEK